MEVTGTDVPTTPATMPMANNSASAIVNGSDITTGSTVPDVQSQQQQLQQPLGLPQTGLPPVPEVVASSESLTSGGTTASATTTSTTTTTKKGATPPLVTKSASSGTTPGGVATTTGKVTLTAAMSATTATSVTTPATTNNNNNNASSNAAAATVKSCAGCGARIVDRFLLHAMDRYWHTGCLKCSCCQAQLGEIGTSCFTKAGMILCKNDYIRLFGSSGTCAACSQNIPAQEFVMRAQSNVYHVNCFTCVTCHQRLVPGDRYSIVNGSLICEQDYPKVLKGHSPLPTMRPTHKVNNNNTNINNRNEADMLPYY